MAKAIYFIPSLAAWLIAGGLEVSGIEIPWLGYGLIALGLALLVIPAWPFIKRIQVHLSKPKEVVPNTTESALEVNVSSCVTGPDMMKPSFLWETVECTLRAGHPPMQVAKLQLLIGGERVDAVELDGEKARPFSMTHSTESHTIRYNPPATTILKGNRRNPDGTTKPEWTRDYTARLSVLAGGQEHLSNEFVLDAKP
ncbi:MAG: hypothetical protein HY330_04905 [Chloroflexi bacterium]|nr:hypothetical protein [Chloroflexota bacterium]